MTTKIKINTGIASIALLASLFAGWQTLLIVTILLFVFCETDEKVKDNAVKVIAFYLGFTIVSTGWGLIEDCVSYVPSTIGTLVGMLNRVLSWEHQIHIESFLLLINEIFSIVDGLVNIALVVVKLSFILAVLNGKDTNKFFMFSLFSKYIEKALHYASNSVVAHSDMVKPMEAVAVAPSSVAPSPSRPMPTPTPAPVPMPTPAPAPVPMATQQQVAPKE